MCSPPILRTNKPKKKSKSDKSGETTVYKHVNVIATPPLNTMSMECQLETISGAFRQMARSSNLDLRYRLKLALAVLQILNATVVDTYTVTAVDCTNPDTINSFATHSICQQPELAAEQPLNVPTVVLQLPKAAPLTGFSCRVKFVTTRGLCGVWGHFKLREPPSYGRYLHVSEQDCSLMVERKEFHAPTGEIAKLNFNKPMFLKSVTVGALRLKTSDGGTLTCSGEPEHRGRDLIQNSIVMIEYQILLSRQDYLVTDNKIESQTDQRELECPAKRRYCVTGEATYLWSVPQTCNLVQIRTFMPNVVGPLFVSHEHNFILNVTGPAMIQGCKVKSLQATTYEDIFISDEKDATNIPAVQGFTVEMDRHLKSLLAYTVHQIARKIHQVEAGQLTRLCQYSKSQSTDEIFKIYGLIYGRQSGDVTYTFQCAERQFEVDTRKDCFDKVPLKNNMYMDPISRITYKYASKTPCLPRFPLIVKTDSGVFISLNPEIAKIPTPPSHTPYSNMTNLEESFSSSGLYTELEVQSYSLLTEFPSYKKALLNEISYGTCSHAQCHPVMTQERDFPDFDLSKLTNMENKMDDMMHPAHYIEKWVDSYAKYCSLIISVFFTCKIVCELLTILVVGTLCGLPAALNLFCEYYGYNIGQARRTLQAKKALETPTYQRAETLEMSQMHQDPHKQYYPGTAILN